MAKEELNAFDVLAATRELAALVGARFDKAFQVGKSELILRFRASRALRESILGTTGGADSTPEAPAAATEADAGDAPEDDAEEATTGPGAGLAHGLASSKVELAVGIGKYVCLTQFPRELPLEPPHFAMTLRKHLSGARFAGVRQHGFDRVIEMELTKVDATYHLVLEFFADGNVILERDGRVVSALLQQSWATREIRPGAEFRMPPPRTDPRSMDAAEFRRRFRASAADAVRTLATEFGLGGAWAEEICARAGVDKNRPQAETPDADVDRLYDELMRAFSQIESLDLDPVIVRDGETKIDVSPIPLAAHRARGAERFPSFMAALDRYFSKAVTVERVDPRVKRIEEEKTKIRRMHDAQEAAIAKFEVEAEEARRRGDLIYGHYEKVTQLSERLLRAAKEFGWKEVQDQLKGAKKAGQSYAQIVDAVNPHEGTATLVLPDLEGAPRRVVVDLTKSVPENANAYYEKSKKMKDKLEGARAAFEDTKRKLADVEARGVKTVADVEKERARAKPTKRFWFESYRWFVSSDGHLVIGGRDAGTNEKVVKRHLDDQDRYLHADVSGAPSCVIKRGAAESAEITERTLEEAAQFAVANSRAWTAGVGTGDAYWVLPTQVSKTPNPGEFVGRGAFIIRGKRNYVRAPVRAAVGEIEWEGARKVMGGPVSAVQARAKRWLVLEPGTDSRNSLANRLAKEFNVPVEEVQQVLPPGDLRVVEERL